MKYNKIEGILYILYDDDDDTDGNNVWYLEVLFLKIFKYIFDIWNIGIYGYLNTNGFINVSNKLQR